MPQNFDLTPDRRETNSIKWTLYPPDVLPLWVADMDFPAPEPILRALHSVLDHGVLGYEFPSTSLKKTVAARMQRIHNWQVDSDWVVATPGIIAGFNVAARVFCQPGQGVLMQTPAYPPFLGVHRNAGLVQQLTPLKTVSSENSLSYEIDWQAFEAAVHSEGTRTGMFLLCNPHNPTGRSFTPEELTRMAEICLAQDVVVCSDEIHNEHLLGDAKHVPVAALSPEISARTVTLVAPSKTFNVPGLFCGFAIISDPELRKRFTDTMESMVMHISCLSLAAAEVAFSGACDDWLTELRAYLTQSRDMLAATLSSDFPFIPATRPEATYMAWLDCSALVASGRIKDVSPQEFFLKQAKVGLTKGADFGPGYENFVRLVFGCSHATLDEALERMKKALA